MVKKSKEKKTEKERGSMSNPKHVFMKFQMDF